MSDKYPGGFVTTGAPAGFSVAFDGSGDNLTLAPGAAFAFGTGDFTIEQWFYPSITIPTYAYLIDARNSGQTANWATGFNLNNTGTGQFTFFDGVSATAYNEPSASYKQNAWNHCVVVRSGTTFSMFMNGVRVYTTTNSTNFSTSSTLSYIGRGQASGSEFYFTGYMSNVRVVKGTAVYSPSATTLTVPTQLFPVTNTQLLACQSPTIIDNSTNNFTITAVGNAAVSNFTPFAAYQGFNPALGAAAGGVWTIDEAAYYQQNRLWPIYDPYFNQTTLMLHGNGTNGAQNNTFLDSSTNNFTITRNGNTTQGTFTPFSQTGWSNYFNAASSLSSPDNTSLDLSGSISWCIEFWMYWNSVTGEQNIVEKFTPAAGPGWTVYKASGGTIQLYASALFDSGVTPVASQWYHIAICRDNASSRTSFFVNGIRTATSTTYTIAGNSATALLIGVRKSSTTFLNGYLNNLRIVKGSSVYDPSQTAFTVPTAPLTAITGTSLLTCQDNRFVDDSANNFAITTTGSPSVQAFSPFVPAYITPTTYSNWFDGSTGKLTFPTSATMSLSGAFTIECWVYWNGTTTSYQNFIGSNASSFATAASYFRVWGSSAPTTAVRNKIGIGNPTHDAASAVYSANSLVANKWNHVAATRDSSNIIRVFINGNLEATGSADTSLYDFGQSGTCIGDSPWDGASGWYSGCISNLRVLKGTALYTASFTPPTAPLTNITNTSLLTCQSSTFIDNSTNNFAITATGNVQPVTSPTPFPAKVDTTTLNSAYSTSLIGGSGYFDGTGDYLVTPSNAAFTFGTGDFTAEAWVYPTVLSGNKVVFDFRAANDTTGYQLGLNSTTTPYVANSGGGILNGTATLSVNSWIHFAVTRSSGTLRIFINGVQAGSIANSLNCTNTVCNIGGNYAGGEAFSGYISNARVVKGTAVYTAAFTPPTALLTAITNTSLLTNYTNGAIFDNTAKNVLETVGNAQISTTQSKYGGTSMSFPATNGNYVISPPNQPNLLFGTGQFTVELWVYPTAFTNAAAGIVGYGLSGGYVDWNLELNTSGTLLYIDNDAGRVSASSNLSLNTWTHIAVARTATAVTVYFNGVSVATYSTINNISGSSTSARLYVGTGAQAPASRQFIGFLDDLRITKGVARYTTNFTPPTSQLQDQ